MGRKQKSIVLPHLVNGDSLNKPAYVEYSLRNPQTGVMKRFREYDGFGACATKQQRAALGRQVCADILQKLDSGWSPFEQEKVTYDDRLLMQRVADRWGRSMTDGKNLRFYASEFLLWKSHTVISHSLTTYTSKLRVFMEWADRHALAGKSPIAVTHNHIITFIMEMSESLDWSRRTVLKYGQILHGFFDYLVKVVKIVSDNPVHDLPVCGRLTDEAARPIPKAVREQLLGEMQRTDTQLWLVCLMEFYCAIRPNEQRQLRIGDIDMEHHLIRVRATISKNRQSETVVMPDQLYDVISSLHLDEYPMDYYLFSVCGKPGTQMLGKNNLRFRFDRLRLRLGLSEQYKLYSFKHTGGVELVNSGVDSWSLQRHFRHKSIDTTERYIRRNFGSNDDKLKTQFPDI